MLYSQNKKFGDLLVLDVINKLLGKHDVFKRISLSDLPSDDIFIGNLHGVLPEKYEDENIKDNNIKLPNSMSIKFLLKDLNSSITIKPKISIFYRVFPTFDEEKKFVAKLKEYDKNKIPLAKVWKRADLVLDNITTSDFNNLFKLDFKKYIDKIIKNNNLIFNEIYVTESDLNSKEDYDNLIFIKSKDNDSSRLNWDCDISINNEDYVQNNEHLKIIEVSLVNNTIKNHSKNSKIYETTIFNPILNISLNNNEIKTFKYNYVIENQVKTNESYLRTLNCQGKYENNMIETFHYATFNERKIAPINSLFDVDISFERLINENNVTELKKILVLMKKHLNNCLSSLENSNQIRDFKYMMQHFEKGIDVIENNPNANYAFKLMNKTFALKSKNSEYKSWRLFQIVFITILINDIVNIERRNICDLLHVMTGGGKSEAYFGIVIFTMFYDRLRGKKYGVSAITKFPLRMLSIQQLQRIANLVIFAEKIRFEENIGGNPFSIAYFVGSQDEEFPRNNFKIRENIIEAKKRNNEIKGKIINICPLCGGEVVLDINNENGTVVHKCKRCNEKFRLYYSDDEIYRMLPTFIVSTVDKFSGVSTNRRFKNLLGGKIDKCPDGHGIIPRNDKCEFKLEPNKICNMKGDILNPSFNTGPTLIIQDEMHLIKEGFGTIDSHFETLIEELHKEFGGESFKNIAMTATISGAKSQIKHLYNKDTFIFPPKLKDKNGVNFFFDEKSDESGNEIYQRNIIGLKPTHSKNTKIICFILKYISEFIKSVENNISEFSTKYNFDINKLKEIIPYYKMLLTYHNKKEEVHNLNSFADRKLNLSDSFYPIETRPLTGDNSLEYIKETIDLVNNYDDEKKIFAVNATNIVSHGVDIDKWNIMVFEGMPRNTAEYIQSLSRVGRKNYGIVFLLFSSKKTRDLSFFQHFTEYHNIISDKVEAVPLSRWATLGFKQTFTSIFCATILNYLSNVLEKPIYNLDDFREVVSTESNRNLIINFIIKAYVVNSDIKGSEDICEKIDMETKERIDYLERYSGVSNSFFPNALKDCDNKYYKTQFGMRGIQDSIVLEPNSSDYNFRKEWKGN
ncbi:MAG: helicase-related protein [Methanobrevibacter boviskoreani]|jgi:hypothetical protein|uniref:helicase-related protein n=2 Tax=Methanobrevibacter boviskoreani TaxID=1348249 RepID=UPI003D8E0828